MTIFKCKMCGGALEIKNNETVATCEYCGTQQTLPKLADDERAALYERANHFRRNNEYDIAMSIYEQIRNAEPTDAEAHWSLVLCRYGIEYVEDGSSKKRVPTVNRAQFTSIFDDEDYKAAIEHADSLQRDLYINEAKTINEIQKGILAISQKEKPFDVFICYKETDINGRRTQDSVLAYDIYQQLTADGYKVFFSRVTLEDKFGIAYEPYIFAALNSAKVMLAIGTKPEHFNAIWVKNEWSRYLALIKKDPKRVLIPLYRDMDPYDLPREFLHLQAQDMSKIGFVQDLLRGINKIIPKNAGGAEAAATDEKSAARFSEMFLTNAFASIRNGDFASAETYVQKVLEQDSENVQAYIAKLLMDLKVRESDALATAVPNFDKNPNYVKILQYGDKNTVATFKGYLASARKNASKKKKKKFAILAAIVAVLLIVGISVYALYISYNNRYENAVALANDGMYEEAIAEFEALGGFKNSEELADTCKDIILNKKYEAADAHMKKGEYIEAATIFESLDGYKDSADKVITCKYNYALALMNEGAYAEAISVFESLNGYKDSTIHLITCNDRMVEEKYNNAIALMNAENYTEAIDAFNALNGYKDSNDLIKQCETLASKLALYIKAKDLMNQGKYAEAIDSFATLGAYKDSENLQNQCEVVLSDMSTEELYTNAKNLMKKGEYTEAINTFAALAGYKDSENLIDQCKESLYIQGKDLYNQKKYSEAKDKLQQITTYKDSSKLLKIISLTTANYTVGDSVSILQKSWIVLENTGSRVLLLSEGIVAKLEYGFDNDWNTSTINTWLNRDFIQGSEYMYDIIDGQIFLLSIEEVNRYSDTIKEAKVTTNWWLRSPGKTNLYVSYVSMSGDVDAAGRPCNLVAGVRPAVWIDLAR